MSKPSAAVENQDLSTLVKGIFQDTEALIGQQIDLVRTEVTQEVRRAAGAAVSIAAGGGLAAAGGLLSGMMLAHLLQRVTRLPLWVCYGAVGGGLSATGIALLLEGKKSIAKVQLAPPPESAEALKENVTWLKEQITTKSP